jgi:type II secretion system protein N
MFNKLKISRRTLSYIAYVIGITFFFLYYLFPSDAIKGYLAYRLSRENPDISVTIRRVSPVLPPGIKLHDVGIAHRNRALIDLVSLKITPGLLSFFSSKKTASFNGRLKAGAVSGRAEIDSRDNKRAQKIEGTISGVQVQGIPALQRLSPHKVSGSLDGDFMITSTGPNPSMTAKLALSNCRIEFDQPVFSLDSLGFNNITADLALNRSTLVIKKFSARGNQLDADISGTIALNSGGRQKALNLTVSVTPHHLLLAKIETSLSVEFLRQQKAGKKAISFRIGGTVDVPEFSLN